MFPEFRWSKPHTIPVRRDHRMDDQLRDILRVANKQFRFPDIQGTEHIRTFQIQVS